MQINWFTVGAQLLNFLLLVWLMKRFLYQPILAAIAAREQKITDQLADAAAQKTAAQAEHTEYEQKNADFEAQKQALLATATADAQTERQRLLEQARQTAEALRAKQAKARQELQDSLPHELARQTRQAVLSLTRKALADLASADLETQAVAVFIGRVGQLQGAEREGFIDALRAGDTPLQVRSAFALSGEQQAALTAALAPLLGPGAACEFITAPELLSGISLNANGYQLNWNIPDYLTELQRSLAAATPDPAAETKPETAETETAPLVHAQP